MADNKNLSIYEASRAVPNEAKRQIGAGRLKGLTDINPMWRIKKLTELFGPCGVGWWYEVLKRDVFPVEATGEIIAFCDINLFYCNPESGEVSKPVFGTGGSMLLAQETKGPHTSDECFKMALTDAISVAAKALGIGADVYFAADRTKYSSVDEKAEKTPALKANAAKKDVSKPETQPISKDQTARERANAAAQELAVLRGNGWTPVKVASEAMKELNVSCKTEAEYEEIYNWCKFEIEIIKMGGKTNDNTETADN